MREALNYARHGFFTKRITAQEGCHESDPLPQKLAELETRPFLVTVSSQTDSVAKKTTKGKNRRRKRRRRKSEVGGLEY